ncbi:MAG: hypothetical protein J0H64_03795 [Actinobacteria bacterium]|nr:hypothetical protein [Actinomycetota bacterium]
MTETAIASADALGRAGCGTEHLAVFIPAGRRLGVFPRSATMHPLGEVWRLGVLLLGTDARLYSAGQATRAAERGRPGYQSLSREDRRDLAAAALRGGYAIGTPVNFDAVPLPDDDAALLALDERSPVGVHDGELRVRWRAAAPLEGAPTIEQYLAERISLLVDPLSGSI